MARRIAGVGLVTVSERMSMEDMVGESAGRLVEKQGGASNLARCAALFHPADRISGSPTDRPLTAS
jgi:hypothetical protein